MVYLGPPPGVTLEEAEERLRNLCPMITDIERHLYDPPLGFRPTLRADFSLEDLRYERKCLMYMLAPHHFRPGLMGKLHRMNCVVSEHARIAKCRQARDLSRIVFPPVPPPPPVVPPHDR